MEESNIVGVGTAPQPTSSGDPVPVPAPAPVHTSGGASKPKQRSRRRKTAEEDDPSKRRCVSTACIACRKRKSKCDGNLPACAACKQVYHSECIYDPNSDHRRKGVYKTDTEVSKTRASTLETLIQAILNYPEDEVAGLVQEIRTCESLDAVAERVAAKTNSLYPEDEDEGTSPGWDTSGDQAQPTFESNLYGKMGDLRLDDGSVRYIGGTSNLIHLASDDAVNPLPQDTAQQENAVLSWTTVTDNADLILHLLNMYFTWHYTYFTTLSKPLFWRDFQLGKPPDLNRRTNYYCTPLLVNAMLALGCHFTSHVGARAIPHDSATAGDHFFAEAKRLMMENDEHEKPHLTTVQALALMSVREAGCGREARGWVYSGMSFRMACDMGLNLDSSHLTTNRHVSGDDQEEDARRITFWGCYLFDKCWSNYMGRLPQLPMSSVTVSKCDVFPDEEASQWSPYTDSGFTQANAQPSRTRAVALQIIKLCEISDDLMKYFYNPIDIEKAKGKAAELKKLSEIHTRLESWRRELPKELEPKEGGLSSVLVMHMFFQLLFIHLFRPFLKYTQATSPLPQNVSPRKLCTSAAAMISKLMRLYRRSHGLRQICNIAVYICHSACTIHLLNISSGEEKIGKDAKRDIIHGVKHLEEIAEGWLCARRTLGILSVLAKKWDVQLPEDVKIIFGRSESEYGPYSGEIGSPAQRRPSEVAVTQGAAQQAWQTAGNIYNTAVPTQAGASSQGRRVGSPSQMPPQDATGLLALQYASANTTPRSSLARAAGTESTSKASPSELFGGIEQLIRDSQDWAYRDQQQLATDFGNWNTMDFDPTAWANANLAGNSNSQQTVQRVNGGPVGGGPQQQQQMPLRLSPHANSGVAYPANADSNNGDWLAMANWLNGMNAYNSMAGSYNEDEWYV